MSENKRGSRPQYQEPEFDAAGKVVWTRGVFAAFWKLVLGVLGPKLIAGNWPSQQDVSAAKATLAKMSPKWRRLFGSQIKWRSERGLDKRKGDPNHMGLVFALYLLLKDVEEWRRVRPILERIQKTNKPEVRWHINVMPKLIGGLRAEAPEAVDGQEDEVAALLEGGGADDMMIHRLDDYWDHQTFERVEIVDANGGVGEETLSASSPLAELEAQLAEAVTAKQFVKAAEIQAQIEASGVAVADNSARIAELEAQLAEAVTAKQFAHAAELQAELDSLQATPTTPTPTAPPPTTKRARRTKRANGSAGTPVPAEPAEHPIVAALKGSKDAMAADVLKQRTPDGKPDYDGMTATVTTLQQAGLLTDVHLPTPTK